VLGSSPYSGYTGRVREAMRVRAEKLRFFTARPGCAMKISKVIGSPSPPGPPGLIRHITMARGAQPAQVAFVLPRRRWGCIHETTSRGRLADRDVQRLRPRAAQGHRRLRPRAPALVDLPAGAAARRRAAGLAGALARPRPGRARRERR